MKERLRAMAKDDFLRNNAVFFVGSLLVAALNYLYHPIMSRMMSVSDFGEVQALFSLLTQAGIPLGIFGMIALNLYTNEHGPDSPQVRQFSLLTFYVALASVIAMLIATPFLMSALQLESAWGIVIVAATLLVSAITIFGRSYLQAAQRFTAVSIASAIGAGGKLIGAVFLVWLGFAMLGALGGFFIASLATYFYIANKAGPYTALPRLAALHMTPELAHELRFGGLILFGTGLTTFFSTTDITLAKHYFSAETAGLYSGVAVIAHIILFAVSSIAAVLLSHIKLSEPYLANRRYLYKGLALTALIGGSGLALMALFPTLIITLMIGPRYAPLAGLLPYLALYNLVIALISIYINFALALRRNSVIVVAIIGVGATALFIAFGHATPEILVLSFLKGSILTVLACALVYARTPRTLATDH